MKMTINGPTAKKVAALPLQEGVMSVHAARGCAVQVLFSPCDGVGFMHDVRIDLDADDALALTAGILEQMRSHLNRSKL